MTSRLNSDSLANNCKNKRNSFKTKQLMLLAYMLIEDKQRNCSLQNLTFQRLLQKVANIQLKSTQLLLVGIGMAE